MTTDPPAEPTPTERAISAWALARLAYHRAPAHSLDRLEAQAESDAEERTLGALELGGDDVAADFLRGLHYADEAIRQAAPDAPR
jgi:hypothetical protein